MDSVNNIVAAQAGRIGHVTLNRPRALNALTLEMIRELDRLLQAWACDDVVEAVVVSGAGDRAFCAGGDVKSLCAAGKAGQRGRDGSFTSEFFRAEYTLNHQIANYPKPYVAYLDGITMGGGVGISVMGSHRIASEFTTFAMPETVIGFYPDVGGSFFLSRLGRIGRLLALTGMRLDGSALVELGLATHFVPRRAGGELVARLTTDGVDAAIDALAQSPRAKSESLARLQELASRCFAEETIEAILESLKQAAAGTDARLAARAQEALDILDKCSPTSLKVTLEQLRRAEQMTFTDCLIMDYRLSRAFVMQHDFYEGVRAVLIDKDQQPKWRPDSIDQVDAELVASYFRELGEGELRLEDRGHQPACDKAR
jgi:enoyl-CoA hydratase